MRLAFSGNLEGLINEDVLRHDRFLIFPLISFTATLHHNFAAKCSLVFVYLERKWPAENKHMT